jgi:hypothetical protein
MSQSRERLIHNLSSQIFSPGASQDIAFRPKKRLLRDTSEDSFSHGIKRTDTPTGYMLKPVDHSPNDLFGNSAKDINRKSLQSFYSPFYKPRYKNSENTETVKVLSKNSSFTNKQETKDIIKTKSITPLISRRTQFENNIPKPQDAKVDFLQIKGLGVGDNESTIKRLCQGLHVVDINADIDNVTGECSGTARVKIRSYPNTYDIEKLKSNCLDRGLEVSYILTSNGKKNNYNASCRDFLDSQLQQEEKRLSTNNLSSDQRKRAILATSDDLFGNSPGTGKFEEYINETKKLKETHKTWETLKKWETIRKNNSKSPIFSKKTGTYNYSRPTISSTKKINTDRNS